MALFLAIGSDVPSLNSLQSPPVLSRLTNTELGTSRGTMTSRGITHYYKYRIGNQQRNNPLLQLDLPTRISTVYLNINHYHLSVHTYNSAVVNQHINFHHNTILSAPN